MLANSVQLLPPRARRLFGWLAVFLALGIVLVEAWGWAQSLQRLSGPNLHELCAVDLEESCRALAIPPDAHVLVVTSALEPLPIMFPLAPRYVTLRVHYPASWIELASKPESGQLGVRLRTALEVFTARGFMVNLDAFASLCESNDFVVALELVGEPMERLLASPRLVRLGDAEALPTLGELRPVWFEVMK
jgi:hypothetical protein